MVAVNLATAVATNMNLRPAAELVVVVALRVAENHPFPPTMPTQIPLSTQLEVLATIMGP